MKYIFAPDSYIYLAKSDLIQECNLLPQNEMDKKGEIALGGIYDSMYEDEKFVYFSNQRKVLRNLVVPYEPDKYTFKENDIVKLEPICSETEKKYLFLLKFNDHGEYKIHRVINQYYVELINENGDISVPIRFCDIKPSS